MTSRAPTARLARASLLLTALLAASALISLTVGYQRINLMDLRHDEVARSLFFRLRLPRVVLACLVGATLAAVGGALQALFRNPLAEPLTLGVSGGSALGASLAIALGWGTQISGTPVVFVAAFAGGLLAVFTVYRIARSGGLLLPGSLLLAGVVINLFTGACVLTLQYVTSESRALQILRWLIGSLDVVGFGMIWRMLFILIPGWAALLALSRDLQLLAIDEETAASLGVNVKACERAVYIASSLLVGVTVAASGAIGFVGLIVPHIVRILFGEDVRLVMPCSLLLGASFLMLADAIARIALGQSELPVGAVTALLGGPFFLWLLRREQRYSAI